jgi:hypothetical protein
VTSGENISENDEWMKNWIAWMKWYGAQMHDVSMGKPTKNEFAGDISNWHWFKSRPACCSSSELLSRTL